MTISAIDTSKMKMLCENIQDYTEKTQASLNQIYDSLDNSKAYLKGDNSSEFYNKITSLQSCTTTITNNLSTYIDDYNNIINSYIKNDTNIASKVKSQVEIKEDE